MTPTQAIGSEPAACRSLAHASLRVLRGKPFGPMLGLIEYGVESAATTLEPPPMKAEFGCGDSVQPGLECHADFFSTLLLAEYGEQAFAFEVHDMLGDELLDELQLHGAGALCAAVLVGGPMAGR